MHFLVYLIVKLKSEKEDSVHIIKNGRKKKRNERCGKFHYLEWESFAKLLFGAPLMLPHESLSYSCLAFSLIEASSDQA